MGCGNPYAGEVALVIDGERRVLKLTLGALAELEDAMAADSLVSLVERFETGAFTARDVARLLLAGLHAGGWRAGPDALLAAEIEGGPAEATRVAAALLRRAFALPTT
ncbi:gene transfer agent family protein [uncultured Jannaschia sp.]|uniref:gene transfer agent family protein n=1 Tax=Jannaschia halovivens TaxID=3388667 RepID=UPI00260FADDC|nr:gene transfer agent family protein [uncultured Jannaschia sp.]